MLKRGELLLLWNTFEMYQVLDPTVDVDGTLVLLHLDSSVLMYSTIQQIHEYYKVITDVFCEDSNDLL